MRVCSYVLAVIILVGSYIESYSGDLIAQRTPLAPTSINSHYFISEQDSSVCPQDEASIGTNSAGKMEERLSASDSCEPDSTVNAEIESTPNSSSSTDSNINELDEEISLLPDPEVQFVEDYMLNFDGSKSRNTIIYGGVVPFVALPDSELSTEDRFFNDESFSFFLYFKRKF